MQISRLSPRVLVFNRMQQTLGFRFWGSGSTAYSSLISSPFHNSEGGLAFGLSGLEFGAVECQTLDYMPLQLQPKSSARSAEPRTLYPNIS